MCNMTSALLLLALLCGSFLLSAAEFIGHSDLKSHLKEIIMANTVGDVKIEDTCLVFYHVAMMTRDDSLDVAVNNIKIFANALNRCHTVYSIAYAVCCMLYAVCCMLYAVCCMLYAVCCMLYAICCMLYAVCCMVY
jgi:hypothetical protein